MNKISREQFDNLCAIILTIIYFPFITIVQIPIAHIGKTCSIIMITILAIISVHLIFRLEHYSSKWIHSITMIFAPFALYSIFLIDKKIMFVISILGIAASVVAFSAFEGIRVNNHIKISHKKIIAASMSLTICLISIAIPVAAVANNNNVTTKVKEENTGGTSRIILEDHIEEISKINSWNNLAADEKLNLMRLIAKIESDNLGLEDTPLVRIQNMNSSLLGSYSEEENLIRINVDHIEKKDGYQYINTIAHECFHAWEYKIIGVYYTLKNDSAKELYPYNKAANYKNELDNYVSGSDDYEKYSTQVVEQDAEAYGNMRCQLYIERISTLENNKSVQ